MRNSKEILAEHERYSTVEIEAFNINPSPPNWESKRSLYHKALIAAEAEVAYLKETVAIISPALECLAKESLIIYNSELEDLDKKYKT